MLAATSFVGALIHVGGIRGSGDPCSQNLPVLGCRLCEEFLERKMKIVLCAPDLGSPY